MDIRPKAKNVEYEILSASVNFTDRKMTITNKLTGEAIEIPSNAYGELQAIMAEIGHQTPTTNTTRR